MPVSDLLMPLVRAVCVPTTTTTPELEPPISICRYRRSQPEHQPTARTDRRGMRACPAGLVNAWLVASVRAATDFWLFPGSFLKLMSAALPEQQTMTCGSSARPSGRQRDRQFDCLNCVPNGRFCSARLLWVTDPG
jgi:hypothetical protein